MSRLNRIGVYWSVMHRRPQDYEYFKRLRPTVIKIMDGGPNDYAWVKANLPYSLVIARDWALSEQHQDMRRDPVGTGRRHAEEWDAHADRLGFDRAKTLILGINEPQVWESGVPEALRQYTIALCDRAAELDLRVGAMQLSVGWPANNGPDTPPDWSPFAGVEDAIRRGNHMLVCHEYWADSGPGENWGWWAGRSLKCPWRVPIVIGECGIDMYVKDPSVPHTARGWHGRMHPTRYAAELAEYVTRMSADMRFVGACVFASDFANHEWWSFDIEPAYEAILAAPVPQVPAAQAHKLHLPVVSNGSEKPQPEQPMSDNWRRSREFVKRWEGGLSLDPEDHGNWTGGRKGKGELKGTNFGISAASYPHLDIANLTIEQADEIYYRDYWLASGADKLPWPYCLLAFDTAVLHGVAASKKWQAEVGNNAYAFAAKRLRVYTGSDNWHYFGAGWVNRVADLLSEASHA